MVGLTTLLSTDLYRELTADAFTSKNRLTGVLPYPPGMDYETPLFFRLMQHAAAVDRDVIGMVSGNPDWDPPTALRDGLQAYADGTPETFQYPPTAGLSTLRQSIADRHDVATDRVFVTNGAAEANYLAMATALDRGAGNEIILPDPVYPYYPGKTTLLDGAQRTISLSPDGDIDPAAVRAIITDQTAAIMITTPNNPTGAVYDYPTMRELVTIAGAHDAVLISDEVYDQFDYSGQFTSALSATPDSSAVMITNSFSKSMAITGFRVGYIIVPSWAVDAVRTRHMLVNVAGSRPAQAAVAAAIDTTDSTYYEQNRQRLAQRVDTFIKGLTDAGLTCYRPDGGFYARVHLPSYESTLAGAKQLIEQRGVAGMPGEAFGEANDWFRFSLTTDRIESAVSRLAQTD